MVRHAPIHRRSDHSDIAICCGRNVRGSSLSTSVVPLSNQVTTLNHKRFKGFKMFSDGHLGRASGWPKLAAATIQSVAITCAQIATMPKNNASDAKVTASSTTARTMLTNSYGTGREHG